MNFFEFWNQYKWRIISVLFAIVFAAFLFTIGFWKTLLLFVLVGIAFFIGTLLDDRYEILQVIGEGGMAIVYKALDHRLNRNVAVKIMREDMLADEEFRSRFCAEAHAVAMLSHPNIVAVYDVSHSDAMEYIVMELVEGITLRQYMDRRGALAPGRWA